MPFWVCLSLYLAERYFTMLTSNRVNNYTQLVTEVFLMDISPLHLNAEGPKSLCKWSGLMWDYHKKISSYLQVVNFVIYEHIP